MTENRAIAIVGLGAILPDAFMFLISGRIL